MGRHPTPQHLEWIECLQLCNLPPLFGLLPFEQVVRLEQGDLAILAVLEKGFERLQRDGALRLICPLHLDMRLLRQLLNLGTQGLDLLLSLLMLGLHVLVLGFHYSVVGLKVLHVALEVLHLGLALSAADAQLFELARRGVQLLLCFLHFLLRAQEAALQGCLGASHQALDGAQGLFSLLDFLLQLRDLCLLHVELLLHARTIGRMVANLTLLLLQLLPQLLQLRCLLVQLALLLFQTGLELAIFLRQLVLLLAGEMICNHGRHLLVQTLEQWQSSRARTTPLGAG
mmetsp:Transcript_15307/g.27245  ORF Transcript_15307/g.27245 Transcript_15307/m.27245 type:complete len:286 (+) Transcript_15307:95-952(+)